MIYLYAIADQPDAPTPSIRGLEGTSLDLLPCRDICAAVSFHQTAHIPTTETNLWRHEAVMESLMTHRAILPARFGVVVADEASVQTALEERYVDFIANLERVRGRVELSLRALWKDSLTQQEQIHRGSYSEQGRGREYMLARLEAQRGIMSRKEQAEDLADRAHAALARISADSVHRVLTTPRLLLTAAYLVERNAVAAFRDKVASLSADHPALRFLCTGPWPPFNFVNGAPIHIGNRTGNKDHV